MCVVASMAAAVLLLICLSVYVPEGATGVRLKRGQPTPEKIAQGMYLQIPGVYEIKVFLGWIHISQLSQFKREGSDIPCSFPGRHKVRALWRVVDGRLFFPLTAQGSGLDDTAAGERKILEKLCDWAARDLSGASGQTRSERQRAHPLREYLNDELIHGFGMEMLQVAVENDAAI